MKLIIMAILSHGHLNTQIGVEKEAEIIQQVANEYELTPWQTKFLAVIRRIENGSTGKEFGVGSEDPNHPARRLQGDPAASVRLQAEWAAGTIKRRTSYRLTTEIRKGLNRRWTCDIKQFACRWCPNDWENWSKNAQFYLDMKAGN